MPNHSYDDRRSPPLQRIYIEPPEFHVDLNNAVRYSEWRQDQVSRLYEAIAKRAFFDGTTQQIDDVRLGEILLALVKLQEMR